MRLPDRLTTAIEPALSWLLSLALNAVTTYYHWKDKQQ